MKTEPKDFSKASYLVVPCMYNNSLTFIDNYSRQWSPKNVRHFMMSKQHDIPVFIAYEGDDIDADYMSYLDQHLQELRDLAAKFYYVTTAKKKSGIDVVNLANDNVIIKSLRDGDIVYDNIQMLSKYMYFDSNIMHSPATWYLAVPFFTNGRMCFETVNIAGTHVEPKYIYAVKICDCKHTIFITPIGGSGHIWPKDYIAYLENHADVVMNMYHRQTWQVVPNSEQFDAIQSTINVESDVKLGMKGSISGAVERVRLANCTIDIRSCETYHRPTMTLYSLSKVCKVYDTQPITEGLYLVKPYRTDKEQIRWQDENGTSISPALVRHLVSPDIGVITYYETCDVTESIHNQYFEYLLSIPEKVVEWYRSINLIVLDHDYAQHKTNLHRVMLHDDKTFYIGNLDTVTRLPKDFYASSVSWLTAIELGIIKPTNQTIDMKQTDTVDTFEPKLNVHGFSSGSDSRPEWCLNQTKRIFGGVASSIGCFARTTDPADTFKYRSNLKVESYRPYLEVADFEACLDAIKCHVAAADLVIIQSYGSRYQLDASTLLTKFISGSIEFKYSDTRDCMSFLISAYIVTCIEQNKPFMLYTFDPILDWNYGINRMHGFIEHKKYMRYMPLLEASLDLDKLTFNNGRRDLLYGGKLSTFDLQADGRKPFHQDIVNRMGALTNSDITVQEEPGQDCLHIGELQDFKSENDYFEMMREHKTTLVPPNYTNEFLSIKRAVDAIENGSVPVSLLTKNGLWPGTPWLQPIGLAGVDLVEKYDMNCWQTMYAKFVARLKELDIWLDLANYIQHFYDFNRLHHYIGFATCGIVKQESEACTDNQLPDLNKLRDAVYQLAIKQGKYSGNPAVAPLLMHTVGEVNEAHAAYMSNRRAQAEDVDALKQLLEQGNLNVFRKYFKSSVKSTFEDELADIMLMVFSIAGYYGIDIATHVEMKHRYNEVRDEHSDTNDYNKR